MVRNGSPSPADNFPLGHSATSPQPQPSKRDKRRNMLAEKLAEMMSSFSDNRDSHYRAQLAALQADINLIMKADPYSNKPLDDGGEEASELISQIMGNNVPSAPSAGTDYIAQCGKHYSRFVDAVNDAMEERDYNLTMLYNKHENTKNEIENSHFYKVQIAEEEHKLLAATIRERLIASIQTRTGRLKREKEQLDLSDSNAMLLHPNQFSIGNPASPGGPQAPRKTRRTGHKFGDAEEVAAANETKRKRKLFEENDNDSPGPAGRNIEMGIGSPFREAKARTINAQFESSAYSLERLFTEKELNMAMNRATTAASHFFAKMKHTDAPHEATANGNGNSNTNGTNGDHASENGDPMDADQDSDDIPGASDMTRQISSNPHATRGATRSALNPTAAIANGQMPFIYQPPFVLDAKVFQKLNAAAPTPPALSAQDVEQDLKLMLRDPRPDDELNEKLLQAACNPVKARDYQVQPPNFHEPVNEITSHIRNTAPLLEVGSIGGVPMSAQSSMAGWSDAGGNTPLRYGERESLAVGGHGGGVPMTRTASGNGRGRGRGRGG
ncbi:Sds3-like-domain-containing protein [Pyrenochaeta sp. MPI-SDFR-AT-0127]|nr:Sds3-like-domain-containing protein [Pyrenochaeta sp. MPI-SDFR-AT-0127]